MIYSRLEIAIRLINSYFPDLCESLPEPTELRHDDREPNQRAEPGAAARQTLFGADPPEPGQNPAGDVKVPNFTIL